MIYVLAIIVPLSALFGVAVLCEYTDKGCEELASVHSRHVVAPCEMYND